MIEQTKDILLLLLAITLMVGMVVVIYRDLSHFGGGGYP